MKKLLILLMSLVLVFVLAACNDDKDTDPENNEPGSGDNTSGPEEKEVTYTVKVLDGDKGVKGATIIISGTKLHTITTDDNGIATVTVPAGGAYSAQLLVLKGYDFDKEAKPFGKGNEIVFNVTAQNKNENQIAYTIKVVDGSGNPVTGVQVQMCEGELCMSPLTTDANGEATYMVAEEKDGYKAKLLESEDGYVSFNSDKLATIVKP